MHIKTGDTVEVISGDNKGQRGEVQRVMRARLSGRQQGQPDPNHTRVIVAGINLVTKHQRRTGNVRTQTGRIEREAPIHISNVMLVCPRCGKTTRVGHEITANGNKLRSCKQCGETIE
ncbi:MAG: 50S ribosomal protein L24 [Caldilineales bacterium]